MHRNALFDPPLPPDAKTQVQRNMSRHTFYGNRSGPTQARKIERRGFASRSHVDALCDPQMPPKAKVQV
jgi:hypothetical protein